jgi:acetyl-CoA carboxylase biotin carboxyl carrier protein
MAAKKVGKKAAASVRAPKTSNDSDRNLAKLREIVKVLESSTLAELSYEDSEIAVEVRRYSASAAPVPTYSAAPVVAAAPAKAVETPVAAAELESDVQVVRSPFVGTFYSSPSPEAEKFTQVGKAVRRGQTLCIIEAMKLMNEIESEVDGIVLAILAENGKSVQYGDALFKIKTGSKAS